MRYDHNQFEANSGALRDKIDTQLSPGVKITQRLNKGQSLYLGARRLFRSPTVADYSRWSTGYTDRGNKYRDAFAPGLSYAEWQSLLGVPAPEKGMSYELGWRAQFGEKTAVGVTGFYYDIDDFLNIQFKGGLLPPIVYNVGNVKVKGVGDSGGKKSYDKVYEPRFPQYKDQWKIISPHNAPFDVEAILTAKPDVLIVNSAMQGHMHAMDIEPRLTEAGIALLLVDVPGTSPQSAQDLYRLLGEVFGEPEKASEVASFLDQQYADLQAGLAKVSGPKPLVYYEKSGSAEIFGPSSRSNVSGWGTLITRAGGENLADRAGAGKPVNGPPGSVSLDPEYILTSDPDFIFLSGTSPMGLGAPPKESIKDRFSIVNRPGWDRLKAVKNKNVYEYQHELARTTCVFYPTLSFAKLFYPEAFANIDPEARLAEFYDRFMLIKSSDGLWKMRLP